MKKAIIAGGFSAILLGSAALYAAPGMGKVKIDADGNGSVSKAESLAAADAKFAKMDINKDGKLDQGDREAKTRQRFAILDADRNGAISEAEFLAAHKTAWAKRGNDDGAMRGKHRGKGHEGRHGGMKKADLNGDQVVTKAEFRTAAEARFATADTNKDGMLSATEMKAGRKHGKGRHHRGPDGHMAPPPPGNELG